MANNIWNDTESSANQLVDTVTGGWSTQFGVSVDKNQILSDTGINNVIRGTEDVTSSVQGITNAYDNYNASNWWQPAAGVADAAGSAALNYLNRKIERIKNAWTTTTQVSVASLIGEVAPYCLDFDTAINNLVNKMSSLVGYLTGVEASSWEELGDNMLIDVSSSLLSDPAVIDSISNLGTVQALANGFSFVTGTINVFRSVLEVVEPLFPYLEIATKLASMLMTAGTSGADAASQTTQTVQAEIQKLISMLMADVRKMLFNIKLQVPSLLVGALNTISVRDMIVGYDSTMNTTTSAWLRSVFDEDFYKTTKNSFTWSKIVNNIMTDTVGWLGSDDSIFEKILGDSSTWGNTMKEKFLANLAYNFMTDALNEARKKSWIQAPSEVSYIKQSNVNASDVNDSPSSNYGDSPKSDLDKILDSNIGESPITDEESIRLISSNIYKGLQ